MYGTHAGYGRLCVALVYCSFGFCSRSCIILMMQVNSSMDYRDFYRFLRDVAEAEMDALLLVTCKPSSTSSAPLGPRELLAVFNLRRLVAVVDSLTTDMQAFAEVCSLTDPPSSPLAFVCSFRLKLEWANPIPHWRKNQKHG